MRDPHLHPVPTAPRRRPVGRVVLLALLAFALAACSASAPQSVLDPQGPAAQQPDDLFRVVLLIALVVFLVVQGLIIYAVVKFRDNGDGELPKQVHGNTKMELVWTIVPALILAGISVPTIKAVFDLAEEPPGAMIVEVIGHSWWWEYRYPGLGPDGTDLITANEMVLPENTDITLKMTAEESGSTANAVIHAYWIPALAGKQDVVPGRITTINLQTSGPDVYMGQCTEYCGLSHANMRNYATVLSAADFDAWVELQGTPAAMPAEGSDAAEGARLFAQLRDVEGLGQRACVSCHAISGYVGPDGEVAGAGVGPDLTHLMDREMFAGAIFDLYETSDGWGTWTDEPNVEDLVKWVQNAPEMKAMRATGENALGMPNLGLTEQEARQIVAYLLTLK